MSEEQNTPTQAETPAVIVVEPQPPEKADNSREARIARIRAHWWKKGQSGNPNPQNQRRFKLGKLLRDVLAGKVDDETGRTKAMACVEEIVNEALKGKEWANKMLFDRIDGPLTQKVDLKQHGNGDVETRLIAFEARIQRVLTSGEDGPDDSDRG